MPVLWSVRSARNPSPGRRGLSGLLDKLAELGIEVDAQLFELSLTHRSYAYEAGGIPSNERLEFLGDAVLQIVVTEHIVRSFPELSEGQLAKLRASVVSATALAEVARALDIGPLIRLGKGEISTGGADKRSILADTTEAIIGGIYLSAGPEAASLFLHDLWDPLVQASVASGEYADYKTTLQELCAERGWSGPEYVVTGEGPDHLRTFTAQVIVDGRALGEGHGHSKRRAEQIAARQAVKALEDA